ncbi:hypothetical protein KEJ27_02955 [Candidatus Bathyarchaeota archaeon]|nr:hypothetical protein [Candidatus Bathyarchaeota archaeon]MBS7613571.1 hypothetical protein [Candidatus Bathyarchaeota archaeon]MBS7618612.1 hypothetical protein [Candidatus Bathyarchaeota archaeon]
MPIKTVKREIRVLGLTKVSLDNRIDVVGVVYRGSSIMDGVLYFKAEEVERHGLPKLIRESKHFKQLRILVLKSEDGFNCEELWMETSIPVLCLGEFNDIKPYGVDKENALKILRIISKENGKPEALKVAFKLKSALEKKFKRG